MASIYIYLSGKAAWAHRLFETDNYLGKEFWSITLYPDPKSLRTFDAAKLLQRKKEDDEGVKVQFKRQTKKPWKLKAGEKANFEPPAVVDADGSPWPSDKLIGNGSEVTLKLEIYNTMKGKSSRLESVRVDNWVEYNSPDEVGPEDEDDEISPF